MHQAQAQKEWSPEMLRLGRFICWYWYRDEALVRRECGDIITEVMETCLCHRAYAWDTEIKSCWRNLLGGAYRDRLKKGLHRAGAQKRVGQGSTASISGRGLGKVVWPGVKSIDGMGDVRFLEVLLYKEVASQYCARANADAANGTRGPYT